MMCLTHHTLAFFVTAVAQKLPPSPLLGLLLIFTPCRCICAMQLGQQTWSLSTAMHSDFTVQDIGLKLV